MPNWAVHNLCAKTRMTPAGVRPDISERVLAHAIPGVEGVYDRWGYLPEKHDAPTRLGALVDRIIHPPARNVALFRQRRAKGGVTQPAR